MQWPLAGEFSEFEYSPKIRRFWRVRVLAKMAIFGNKQDSPDSPTFAKPFTEDSPDSPTFAKPFTEDSPDSPTFAKQFTEDSPDLPTFAEPFCEDLPDARMLEFGKCYVNLASLANLARVD